MRILEIAIGITLLGGAVWTGFRTYRGRGTSSYFIMAFAMFLAALGLFFFFGGRCLGSGVGVWLPGWGEGVSVAGDFPFGHGCFTNRVASA